MSYNYQDAPRESQQEYFGKVHTDNKETLYNALKRIEELEKENFQLKQKNQKLEKKLEKAKEIIKQFLNDYPVITKELLDKLEQFIKE